MSASSSETTQYAFVTPIAEPEPGIYVIFFLILFIFIFIIALFVKNMLVKKEQIRSNSKRYYFWTDSLITAAKCSILLGVIGTLVSAYQFLLSAWVIGAFDVNGVAGIAESLLNLVFGLTNSLLAVVFTFFCRLKGTIVLDHQTKTVSQSPI